ncbi:MAG: penicillin-binding protein 2 [candidate division WOR-3 bacterium]
MTRTRAIVICLLLWSAAIALRLIWLQGPGASKFKEMGKRQFLTRMELPGERGIIYDRKGALLAGNSLGFNLYQSGPVSDPRGALARLGISPKPMGDKKAILLARGLSPESAEGLSGVKGIFMRPGSPRFYPLGDATRGLVGAVGHDGVGLSGAELLFDKWLSGESGYEIFLRTADGNPIAIPGVSGKLAESGHDIYLTIDADLEDFAFSAIKATVEDTRAKKGFVLVLDPSTGEVLAIAQYPPSERIYALTDPYEPGSTLKPLIMAKALELGLINLSDSVPIGQEKLRVGKHFIGDVERFPGGLSWRDALIHSSNRAMAYLGLKLGPKNIYEVLRRFGLLSPTGICLPGEWAPKSEKPSRWSMIRTANSGMGQGVMVTGIGMAMAFCAIANRGELLAPRIIKRMALGGEVKEFPERIVVRRAVSPEICDTIRELMIGVVEEGTGRKAKIEGISIAGKTGTAQKPDPVSGGYSESRVIASFVGFFPALSPRYLIYVVVDEPETAHYGGDVAAPCFRKIALFLINRDYGLLAMEGS